MKNNLFTLALVVSGFLATSVYAADGVINFTGEIIDSACQVDANSVSKSVSLGKIAASSFAGVGSTATATNFQLVLAECPLAASSATIKFDGTSVAGDNSVLALTPNANVAKGVGIQLSDASQNVINLFENSAPYTLKTGAGSTTNLDFTARYIATQETVSAGSANAVAQFTVIYQ
ncbi:fimbrial protein [Yersinia sp. 2545 StPb PI]|uniref:fimbrial protein n=1 Tax=unclassified Yersinia (in: enterobacteria) TaxID=2653513 RepID=UPI003FA464CB